jgi:hypothetical protein
MDKNILSDGSEPDQARSRASTNEIGQGFVNDEAMQGIESAPTSRHGAWAAVNSVSPQFEADDRSKYQGSPANQYNPTHQQSPIQYSNPPSLISTSNGDSTPGMNPPYAPVQPYHTHGGPPDIAVAGYGLSIAQNSTAPMGLPGVAVQY